jgi:CRP-like cAMP-binding protein
MNSLISIINSFIQIKEETKTAILDKTIKIKIPKGTFLLEEGQLSNNLYFVEKGLLRGFTYVNEKEITNWFAIENEFATSMYSFTSRNPSSEYIEALEDSDLALLSYSDLHALYSMYSEMNLLGRRLIEDYYLELNERVISFQFLTAKERYSQFLKSKSNLVLRITDNHIASYLGISPEKFPPYQKVMTVQKMRLTSIC